MANQASPQLKSLSPQSRQAVQNLSHPQITDLIATLRKQARDLEAYANRQAQTNVIIHPQIWGMN
jgi:hypothetical protein